MIIVVLPSCFCIFLKVKNDTRQSHLQSTGDLPYFFHSSMEDPFNITGGAGVRFDRKAKVIAEFREQFPIRASGGIIRAGRDRPKKDHQKPWTVYEQTRSSAQGIFTPRQVTQQWFLVPTLLPIQEGSSPTPSFTDDPAMGLFRVRKEGRGEMEHYTNIRRVAHLAEAHPLVQNVRQHKPDKQLDPSQFDIDGRAVKYHQSPWDLRVTLAASGAQMIVGVSAEKTAIPLLSLWWHPIGPAPKHSAAAHVRVAFPRHYGGAALGHFAILGAWNPSLCPALRQNSVFVFTRSLASASRSYASRSYASRSSASKANANLPRLLLKEDRAYSVPEFARRKEVRGVVEKRTVESNSLWRAVIVFRIATNADYVQYHPEK